MASSGDRHTKRHIKNATAGLKERQRELLLACVEGEDQRAKPAEIRWQALLRELAGDDESKKTSMRNALRTLAARRLVHVTYYGNSETRAKSYTPTALGHEVALELKANGGMTRASARRDSETGRADPAAAARRKWTKARQRASRLVLDDPNLISELERRFGSEPCLGGGTPIEEAAKRFLLLARSTLLQDYARKELEHAQGVLTVPGEPGELVLGAVLAWAGQSRFDPNDPVFNAQLDEFRRLFKASQRSRGSNEADEADVDMSDD